MSETQGPSENEIFLSAYVRKQEEFLQQLIRNKLDLEVRAQIMQDVIKQHNEEVEALRAQLQQSQNIANEAVAGMQALQKDNMSLAKETEQIKFALNEATHAAGLVKEVQGKLKNLENDHETLKKNYDLVRDELSKRVLQEQQAKTPTKKK